jgi:hypothetical protein
MFWTPVFAFLTGFAMMQHALPQQIASGTNVHASFDTIKGSDVLFVVEDTGPKAAPRIILNFNDAYNPSCAYNGRWICPLAPVEN